MEVNIHEAKTNLSRLIERALQGEEVIIAKAERRLFGSHGFNRRNQCLEALPRLNAG